MSDKCETGMGKTNGEMLSAKKHGGTRNSMVRKSSNSIECLSPSLKQNLKLKSFDSGKKTGTGMSEMGSTVKGKHAQKRGGKLSKIKSSVMKDKIDLFEIFQGKKNLKAKKTEDLVTTIESKSNSSLAGKDQVILASRLRTNGSGTRELWSLRQNTMWPGTGSGSK